MRESQQDPSDSTHLLAENSKALKNREDKQLGENGKQNTFCMAKYEDLPAWLQDNQYILSGYRVNFSCILCVKTLFYKHNETWCIWTHIIGFLIFFILSFVIPFIVLDSPSLMDKLIFSIFLICAQLQMLFSSLYHIFCCYSAQFYKWLAKLDYLGISIMIVGSYYPPLYYGFSCYPTWKIVYLSSITFIGGIGVVVSCVPVFATPRFRIVRTVFFIIFGSFAIFPIPHLWVLNGLKYFWPIILGELAMGSLYLIGAIFYSSRVPERYYPGKFDFGLSSHVIWHFFTIAAALLQLYNCFRCYDMKKLEHCS